MLTISNALENGQFPGRHMVNFPETYNMPGDQLKWLINNKFQNKKQHLKSLLNHWENKHSCHSQKKTGHEILRLFRILRKPLGKQHFASAVRCMPRKDTVRRPMAHEGIPMGHVENHWENKLLRVDGTMERDAFSASLFRHSGNLTVIRKPSKTTRKTYICMSRSALQRTPP